MNSYGRCSKERNHYYSCCSYPAKNATSPTTPAVVLSRYTISPRQSFSDSSEAGITVCIPPENRQRTISENQKQSAIVAMSSKADDLK